MQEFIKDYIKAFIAGLVFPYLLFVCIASFLAYTGNIWILQSAPLYLVGLIWGLWNLVYFLIVKRFIDHIENTKLLFGLHGAILGVLIYLIMVVLFKVPTALGLPSWILYPMIVGIPILYFLCWYFIVAWLNEFFDFEI